MPGERLITWSVEARIEFQADNQPTTVRLLRPLNQYNYSLLDESTASPGFGVAYLDEKNIIEWTKTFLSCDVLSK